VGLVSLQAINIAKTNADMVMFEPIPTHVRAIKYNLVDLNQEVNLTVNKSALSDRDGKTALFVDATNYGRSSLLQSRFDLTQSQVIEIELTNTAQYFSRKLKNYDNYVIKGDAEGFDSWICANIPIKIWKNTICAVIELSAWENVEKRHIEQIFSIRSESFKWSWQANSIQIANFDEVRDFWLGGSGVQKNLFLSQGDRC
jgi:FkbM family methyltransferase